jgi:hypothetical protein
MEHLHPTPHLVEHRRARMVKALDVLKSIAPSAGVDFPSERNPDPNDRQDGSRS